MYLYSMFDMKQKYGVHRILFKIASYRFLFQQIKIKGKKIVIKLSIRNRNSQEKKIYKRNKKTKYIWIILLLLLNQTISTISCELIWAYLSICALYTALSSLSFCTYITHFLIDSHWQPFFNIFSTLTLRR